jgi:cytochrome c553
VRVLVLASVVLASLASATPPKAREKTPVRRVTPWSTSHVEVQQLTGDAERGKRAWGICSGCHGAEGFGRSDGVVPSVAGQLAPVIVKQLVDIRTGRRDSVFMYRFAVTLTDPQEVADLASYLASLEPSKENGKGSGLTVEQGRTLYERHCVACHGRRGEGEGSLFFPRLTGQHAKYVRRSLLEIKEGTRRNANATMQKVLQDLTAKDLDALADYVSQLTREPAPESKPGEPTR